MFLIVLVLFTRKGCRYEHQVEVQIEDWEVHACVSFKIFVEKNIELLKVWLLSLSKIPVKSYVNKRKREKEDDEKKQEQLKATKQAKREATVAKGGVAGTYFYVSLHWSG